MDIPRATAPPLRRAIARLALRLRASEERTLLVALLTVVLLLGLATLELGAALAPVPAQTIPLAAGGLRLRVRRQRVLVAAVAVVTVIDVLARGLTEIRVGAVVVVALMAAGTLALASGRESLGVSAPRGESMLAELKARLAVQGALPALGDGWRSEFVLRPADGAGFAGDFVVSTLREDGRRLEVALVDVSGKGLDAGTRALMLSGALSGLLGAVPPARFLVEASEHLVGQDWEEGFATAVHVSLDLVSGEYDLRIAGHPPAAHLDAGSGRWRLSDAEGPALGLLSGATYAPERGRLRHGDALVLYTDGLVEVPGRDLTLGIDKLLGEAERLVPTGFAGGADRLVDAVAPFPHDDRALLLLWRGRD